MNRVEQWLADNTDHGLPVPGFEIEKGRTAVVITDPQNDFLHPDGVAWGVCGESATENNRSGNDLAKSWQHARNRYIGSCNFC